MPTQKQIDANRANAQLSTGPKTAAGKETSAANSVKHGITGQKYLTSSESPEEFEAEFAARRRLYPPNDPIIDSLVRKITLAQFRIDRGFGAEADLIRDQGSLCDVFVNYEKPIKLLGAYEASNRRTLKSLEEELARYLSMFNEAGETDEPEPTPPKQRGPSKKKEAAKVHPSSKASTSTPTPDIGQEHKTNGLSAGGNLSSQSIRPATASSSGANATSAPTPPSASPQASSPTVVIDQNPTAKPIPVSAGKVSVSVSVPAPPTTGDEAKAAPKLVCGSNAPVDAKAGPTKSGGSTSSAPTPGASAVPRIAPMAKIQKTNPISTTECAPAEPTTGATKIVTSVKSCPSPLAPMGAPAPLQEPHLDVAITNPSELDVPLTAAPPPPPGPQPMGDRPTISISTIGLAMAGDAPW